MRFHKICAVITALALAVSSGILSGSAAGEYAEESAVSLLASEESAEQVIEPETTEPATTDIEIIYESEGWITLDTTPAQYYDVGAELDFTGLGVSLEYIYGADGHDVIFDSVNPLDHPEAFIVDTSEYDSSVPGTYTIHISCTEEYVNRYRIVGNYTCFSVFVVEEIIEPADTCEVTIDQLPDKVNYTIGESLDLTGAVVSADYRSTLTYDVSIESVPLTENLDKFHVDDSAFDSTTPGTYPIYITYYGAHTYGMASFDVTVAEAAPYPSTFEEYTAFLEAYPELYRVDEESVYFLNPRISDTQLSLIVSSNQEASVDRNTYGCLFKPEEDGRYVVTVQEDSEEIISAGDYHFHYFYPVLKNYVVDVTDGVINVELQGSKSWYSEEQVALESQSLAASDAVGVCYDVTAEGAEGVLDEWYFSYVNGQMPDTENGYGSYITTVYGEYTTESYFCTTLPWTSASELDVYIPRVVLSDASIGEICPVMTTCSYVSGDLGWGTCDVIEFYRVRALCDGDLTVTVDEAPYPLTVENGIFHHADSALQGDVNNDGAFSVVDVVMLQRALLGKGELTCWQNADFYADNKIDAFDLSLMKRAKVIE